MIPAILIASGSEDDEEKASFVSQTEASRGPATFKAGEEGKESAPKASGSGTTLKSPVLAEQFS